MKQFFSDLKKSLKTPPEPEDYPQEIFKPKAYRNGKRENDYHFQEIHLMYFFYFLTVVKPSSRMFAFPKHMQRMMFGSQNQQPYAHSGLGRR